WPGRERTRRLSPPRPPRAIRFRAKTHKSPLKAQFLIAIPPLPGAIAVTLRNVVTWLGPLALVASAFPATPGVLGATRMLLRVMPETISAASYDPFAMTWSTRDCEAYKAGHMLAGS